MKYSADEGSKEELLNEMGSTSADFVKMMRTKLVQQAWKHPLSCVHLDLYWAMYCTKWLQEEVVLTDFLIFFFLLSNTGLLFDFPVAVDETYCCCIHVPCNAVCNIIVVRGVLVSTL